MVVKEQTLLNCYLSKTNNLLFEVRVKEEVFGLHLKIIINVCKMYENIV